MNGLLERAIALVQHCGYRANSHRGCAKVADRQYVFTQMQDSVACVVEVNLSGFTRTAVAYLGRIRKFIYSLRQLSNSWGNGPIQRLRSRNTDANRTHSASFIQVGFVPSRPGAPVAAPTA